jgi:hypothetical protein
LSNGDTGSVVVVGGDTRTAVGGAIGVNVGAEGSLLIGRFTGGCKFSNAMRYFSNGDTGSVGTVGVTGAGVSPPGIRK